jgi:membrane associated rhomboid family serine protease
MTEFRPSRFEILPIVIKNLLIINVLFFLAENVRGDEGEQVIYNLLALHHVKSPLFQPWQLVTHLFLHANFMHLFGNMFGLWMFGSVLENLWGPKRFLTFYFLCGIGAALIHLTSLWFEYHGLLNDFMYLKLHPSEENIVDYLTRHGSLLSSRVDNFQEHLSAVTSTNLQQVVNYVSDATNAVISEPTLGASGAVFGVLAAFVYLFPNTYIYLYFFVPVKAKWMGLFYFGYELFQAIQNSAGDNVARWAHVGGGLVGFLLVLTWNKKNRRNFY